MPTLWPPKRSATAAPLSLEAYVAELQRVRAQLAAEDATAATLADARRTLNKIEEVRLPSGYVIGLRPLLGKPDDALALPTALARVELALGQLAAATNDDTGARLTTLAQVLAGPEFGGGESLLDRIRRWLAELWARFFPARTENPATAAAAARTSELVGWVVAALGALLVIWLLSYWLQKIVTSFVADAATTAAATSAALPDTPQAARALPKPRPVPATTGMRCVSSTWRRCSRWKNMVSSCAIVR